MIILNDAVFIFLACKSVVTIFFLQITIGRRNFNQGERVEHVDDHIAGLTVDSFVAVSLANCNKTPVIGKVTAIGEDTISIHYWKGGYNSEWHPDSYRARSSRSQPVPWIQDLPKDAILLSNFQLNENNRLLADTKRYLKRVYAELQQQNLE